MSAFDIHRSLDRAASRLGERRRRADAGKSRMDPAAEAILMRLLGGRERPPLAGIVSELQSHCRRRGLRAPSRAAAYQAVHRAMETGRLPAIAVRGLPPAVRATLHNVAEDAAVPGDQIVFCAFNAGTGAALSYAAGMPWLLLRRAEARRGWRPKSLALLRAVLRFRGC